MKKTYKVKDLCEFFEVTRQAVDYWIKTGNLNVVRTPSGQIRITRKEYLRITKQEGDE